jgi:serine/threonine protein kinase
MKDELPAGTIIGSDYRVIKTLGRGGFGITYKCEDIRLKFILAVKEYFPDGMVTRTPGSLVVTPTPSSFDMFEWGRKKFLLEGTTLAAIQHKYSSEFIVKIIRFVEERQTAYLAMEFIDGMQIDDFALSNNITSAGQVEALFKSLCIKALKPIHDSNFYHRDIKPSNILVRSSNNEPVIIDFGAARQTAGGKSTVALLTPRYSAVEQYASQEDMDGNDNRDLCGSFTDIYSLAATFYFIIKGEPPQDAPTRLLNEKTENLLGDASLSHYSDEFLQQIDWGMRAIPKNRPQTVDEWLLVTPIFKPEKGKTTSSKQTNSQYIKNKATDHLQARPTTAPRENSAYRVKIGVAMAFLSFFMALTLWSGLDETPNKGVTGSNLAKKIESPKIKSGPEKRSWLIGIDATEWTSIDLVSKLQDFQSKPDGTYEIKIHAADQFRVKTQKGMAVTKEGSQNYGEPQGEVFLKSVNSRPQKIRVEIIHSN